MGADPNTTEARRESLLREAMVRLDMAFCLVDDERASMRFAETRDKISKELGDV